MAVGFMVVRRAPVDTLDVWVVLMVLATVAVLAGASVLDCPLVGENIPGGLVAVSLWCDTTAGTSLPAVEADMMVLGVLGIAADRVVGTAVGTVAGGSVDLSGICGVCDWLVTAGTVGLVAACTNMVVVTAMVALVVMSVFTLGAKARVASGPLPAAALMVLVTAGATIVIVMGTTPAAGAVGAGVVLVPGLVAPSVSSSSALMLLIRNPEEEKRKPIVNKPGHSAKVASVPTVKVQRVKFCHLAVKF